MAAAEPPTREGSPEPTDAPSPIPPPPPLPLPPPVTCRRVASDDVTTLSWRRRRRHVFVLSEAGKPIYSRHGNEEALAGTMGVIMALVSFVQSNGNQLRAVRCDGRTLVFEHRSPLLLVSVSRGPQPPWQLRAELCLVQQHILSLLTQHGLTRIFTRRRGFDLRRLLSGSEAVLDRLLNGPASDGRLLLKAVKVMPMPGVLRRGLGAALRRAAIGGAPAPALALVAVGGQLVMAARQKAMADGGQLSACDVQLVINLLKVGSGEVWSPVCLPCFNPDGFFYAYAAALDETPLTLILLLTQREGFYAASACRRRLEEELKAQGWMEEMGAAIKKGYTHYGPDRAGTTDLWHFLYKPLEGEDDVMQVPQFTCPDLHAPLCRPMDQQRLFALYHGLQGRLRCSQRPLRLLYRANSTHTLLAWVTARFELYACLSPLLPKAAAIAALTRLLRWLRKEDDWLFARCPPPFAAPGGQQDGTEQGEG